MALCTTCNTFDLRRIFYSPSVGSRRNTHPDPKYIWNEQVHGLCFRHSENISQVQVAASAGCGLCGLLFNAFKRKEPEAAQDAGKLPIVLTRGGIIEDERNDLQLRQHATLEPRLRSFFLSPEEGLIGLCDLDLSSDNGMCLDRESPRFH